MSGRAKMRRVSRRKPCPICGRPDWCLVAEDGSAAICPRTPDDAVKEIPGSGWLHILRKGRHGRTRQRGFSTRIRTCGGRSKDFGPLAKQYQEQLTAGKLNTLAFSLGVSTQSLKRLRIGSDDGAHTFPMSDSQGQVIGIRRRLPSGGKLSVIGSKNGLFIPTGLKDDGPLLIVEGESDLAAALDLGFDAFGRPNCNSKIEMTAKAAKGRSEIVIIGDADAPGRAGAQKLADALALHYPIVKITYPPEGMKDLRQWFRAGLSREVLQQLIQRAKPIEVRINFQD